MHLHKENRYQILPVTRDCAQELTELCLRSKQHWGYDETFMQLCVTELTLHPTDFENSYIRVVKENENIIGMVQLSLDISQQEGEIDKLFVDPQFLGKGVGKMLWNWAIDYAQQQRIRVLFIDADPNAKDFYLKLGAIKIGETPSLSIKGRMLPQLQVNLKTV